MVRYFKANGKLMISGEYLVLKGALALMTPLRVGQFMQVETLDRGTGILTWNSTVSKHPWFSTTIDISNWSIVYVTEHGIADRLLNVLRMAASLKKGFLLPDKDYVVSVDTGFDMHLGFGSSSALIANVAQWAGLNPFDLYFQVASGSGADIAAAVSKGPLLYKLKNRQPAVEPVSFHPPFHQNLCFVYLGRKQDTAVSLEAFRSTGKVSETAIQQLDRITYRMLKSTHLIQFGEALQEHEAILAGVLGRPIIREERFPDFPGAIKSLGAWGGDCALAASEEGFESMRAYFLSKGLNTVISFGEIIL
jgi:mevalonate kinase